MEQADYVMKLREIARSHDLEALRDEIAAVLASAPSRPFVPASLVEALDRYVDSYLRQPLDEL